MGSNPIGGTNLEVEGHTLTQSTSDGSYDHIGYQPLDAADIV